MPRNHTEAIRLRRTQAQEGHQVGRYIGVGNKIAADYIPESRIIDIDADIRHVPKNVTLRSA